MAYSRCWFSQSLSVKEGVNILNSRSVIYLDTTRFSQMMGPIITVGYPYFAHVAEIWGVSCEFKVWSLFTFNIILLYAMLCHIRPCHSGSRLLLLRISGWCHGMEILSILLALCEGNPPVTGGFPSQEPVIRGFEVSFMLTQMGCWTMPHIEGPLWVVKWI